MSTEEFNALRTELLVTQQKNIGITGELESLRRSLCLTKHIIWKTEGHLRQANLNIERLYSHVDGNDLLP